MSRSEPARIAGRRLRWCLLAGLAIVGITTVFLATAFGETEGVMRAGVPVFAEHVPAVANLDPRLAGALRRAATDARRDGVEILVNSGWRSRTYQQDLLRDAVAKYGSAEAAARWVAPPDRSSHVSGDAVDLGPSNATAWLARHGARYGLCGIYRNEPWHFELRPAAVGRGCPARYADPSHDPRMQQQQRRLASATGVASPAAIETTTLNR